MNDDKKEMTYAELRGLKSAQKTIDLIELSIAIQRIDAVMESSYTQSQKDIIINGVINDVKAIYTGQLTSTKKHDKLL